MKKRDPVRRPQVRKAARAIRGKIKESHEAAPRGVRFAEVRRTEPLQALVTDSSLELDDDDLVLGYAARHYQKQTGLKKGDTFLVQRTPSGTWSVVDVLTDTKIKGTKSGGGSPGGAAGPLGVGGSEEDAEVSPGDFYVNDAGAVWAADSNGAWVEVGGGTEFVAGAGLLLTGTTLDVGQGSGISVSADAVAVDSTVARLNADLLLTSGVQIDFADEEADKIYLWGNSYGIGIETGSLTNWSATIHRWRIGGTSRSTGTERMALTDAALNIATTGGVTIGTDTNLFRQAADVLKTDDDLHVRGGDISGVSNDTLHLGEIIGGGASLYILRTADNADRLDVHGYRYGINFRHTRNSATGEKVASEFVHSDTTSTWMQYSADPANNYPRIRLNAGGPAANPALEFATAAGTFDAKLYREAADVLATDDSLAALGRKWRRSNNHWEYEWYWGGVTDLGWKTIANVNLPGANLYMGASFHLEVTDAYSNLGSAADLYTMQYRAACVRSAGTQDVPNNAVVSGPYAEYVRVVKTATGIYELQVRQPSNYRHMHVKARVVSVNETAPPTTLVSWVDSPVDGSTSGTIYTATAIHHDTFANLYAGSLALATDLPITEGGTGASDAATARTNLGITSGNIGAAAYPYPVDTALVDTGGTWRLYYGSGGGITYVKSTNSSVNLRAGDDSDAYVFGPTGATFLRSLAFATGGKVDFADELGDKLYLYQNLYGFGIEGGTQTAWANQHRWRIGGTSASTGTERMVLSDTALALNSIKVTGMADPTAAQDAATKAYVDSKGGGFSEMWARGF
jgi:hypothetical protein